MIVNFEEITANLPHTSVHKYALCLADTLKLHFGVGSEINNLQIRKYLLDKGYILTPAQARQTLHYIRVHFVFMTDEMTKCVLCANKKGYYLTDNQSDIDRYKLSLQQRINSISEILESI